MLSTIFNLTPLPEKLLAKLNIKPICIILLVDQTYTNVRVLYLYKVLCSSISVDKDYYPVQYIFGFKLKHC